jgi:hypothetical protein
VILYSLEEYLMKKVLLIGSIVALVLIVVGGAGVVYAAVRGLERNTVVSVSTPRIDDNIVQPFGPGGMMREFSNRFGPGGMMGGNAYGPGGMMGGRGIRRGAGIMHDYMISAFADAVGLTVEQVDTRLADSETFKEIAIAQGTSEADLPALVTQVRKAALDKAVADGVITQAQADRMTERMDNLGDWGLGFGDCPMWDGDETQP